MYEGLQPGPSWGTGRWYLSAGGTDDHDEFDIHFSSTQINNDVVFLLGGRDYIAAQWIGIDARMHLKSKDINLRFLSSGWLAEFL